MTSEIEARLVACFLNVFPNLSADEIRRGSTASLADWDSVAHVTLLSAVSEEFGITLEMEDFEDLVSYALILDRLEGTNGEA